jgi:ATP:ADP antiporter, AAA family
MLKRLWVDRSSRFLFFLMFSIVCLLNVNYNILRSARNALIVVDLGHGAGIIPIVELCGTMPASLLMVYLLTRLMNRFSINKVFNITIATFLCFFVFFTFGVYPFLAGLKNHILHWTWFPWHNVVATLFPQICSMLFFIMAELWKIALLTVLFWGLVNQCIPMKDAKQFYSPLMLGGSIGTIVSGPLISICTSDFVSQVSWGNSLSYMMIVVALLGVVTAWLYSKLLDRFSGSQGVEINGPKEKISVWESLRMCFRSKYLTLLAWITVADYIAYALGETIFLDVLTKKFPDPRMYCKYMGRLSLWSGILTAVSAIVITPYLLRRCRWMVASLITPLCILITEGIFFFLLWMPGNRLNFLVFFGTVFYCFARAAKYTLFDSSKEISFLLLPPIEKMQGKLVVDGMCSRIGRGGASVISIAFIQLCGSVFASAAFVGPFVLGIGISCVMATIKLGTLFEKKSVLQNGEKLQESG